MSAAPEWDSLQGSGCTRTSRRRKLAPAFPPNLCRSPLAAITLSLIAIALEMLQRRTVEAVRNCLGLVGRPIEAQQTVIDRNIFRPLMVTLNCLAEVSCHLR